jgi:CheY-like chemotaxis protein
MTLFPQQHRVLVVDDEPDVLAVTRLSLRGMSFDGREVLLEGVESGKAAVAYMEQHPDTAVILLDVVMESDRAGLEACQHIREQLGNQLVRILLRTGQPGIAPEKEVIDGYDIDGYLLKTELTSSRLYAAVRTGLKAFQELLSLERHRELLRLVHDCATEVRAFDDQEVALQKIAAAAQQLAQSDCVVLWLSAATADGRDEFLQWLGDQDGIAERAQQLADQIRESPPDFAGSSIVPFEDGFLLSLQLYRDLGHGWLYVKADQSQPLISEVLPVLASHSINALYAIITRQLMEERNGPFYDTLGI